MISAKINLWFNYSLQKTKNQPKTELLVEFYD